MRILFVSLGCDKNLVDTEYMIGALGRAGHTFTNEEAEAEAAKEAERLQKEAEEEITNTDDNIAEA